jgi:hypothetical protein
MEKKQVPTLFELALQQAPVQSPDSRAFLDEAARRGHMDAITMELVNDAELGHLHCRGRVPPEMQARYGHPVLPDRAPRQQPGVLDAKLQSYCEETEEVVVRLDSWVNPAFWAECRLPLAQLQQWLREQGVDMQYRSLADDPAVDEDMM